MNTVLVILAVLGLGALVIAAYVFMVSARNNMSENYIGDSDLIKPATKSHILRNEFDRRQQLSGAFPLIVKGMTIPSDRRICLDRRLIA